MRTRFSCLLASACLALWPSFGAAMPVEGEGLWDVPPYSSRVYPFTRIAAGYSYATQTGEFLSVTAPSQHNGILYDLFFSSAGQGPQGRRMGPGETYSFAPGAGVTWFLLFCFDDALFFDADDPTAFPAAYQLTGGDTASVMMEPMLIDFAPVQTTPLPASLWLLLAAAGGLAALHRRVKT